MPYEKGGRADKDGNRFEIRWVVYQLLQVLEEKLEYISLESLGDDEKGIDVWISRNNGVKEAQQCKGRNGSEEVWNYASINAKGIFEAWRFHLDRDISNTVSLVSPLAFTFLEDLIKRAKSSGGNPSKFYSNQILSSSTKFISFFDNFCKAMSINKLENSELLRAISYLNRIIYRQTPDENLKEIILDKIRYLLAGEEYEIYDFFISWVVEGNILGKEISSLEIYKFLEDKNLKLGNLAFDKKIMPRIKELNAEYEKSFVSIDDNLIIRDEFSLCRKMIDNGESVVIHGKAGRGKSGCTVDIINYCQENSIPYLSIKLDKRIPRGTAENWGKDIGLPTSITYCIDSIARNKRAVIILDQLDALRWTQAHSRESLVVCGQIIDQVTRLNFERKYNISVIFVCRSYDLENDNNISILFKESDKNIDSIKWNRIQVNDLSEEIVHNIIGERYIQLTNKLKEVLKIPSNLYIWKQLDPRKNYAECSSTSSLVSEWWKQLTEKCCTSGLNEIELNRIREEVVSWLEKKGKIYFPLNVFNISQSYIEFLASNSFFIIHGNKGSFAHQSILDHFLAEELMSRYFNGESVIDLIGSKDKQTPSKRYQVQMFLEMLLEYDICDFLEAGQQIFEANKIRYAIKFVFLEILSQVEILDENIQGFIFERCEDKLYEKHFTRSVFMGKPQYVRFLRQEGFLSKWLKDRERKEVVFNLLESISPEYILEDVQFIKEHAFESEENDNRFIRCFPYDLNEDTDELFDLRMTFYEKYPQKADSYINIKNMMKNGEMRAIRIIEFFLKNKLNKQGKNIYTYKADFLDSISEIIVSSGMEIINLLVPYIPAEKDVMLTISGWSGRYEPSNGLERTCMQIVKKANANIISSDPLRFWEYYKKFMGQGFYLFNEILLDGFIQLPKSYSDLVIEYLIQDFDNNIFVLTDESKSELSLAKKVLVKHAENCSQEIFSKLENKILKYFPSNAKERYKRRIECTKENGIRVYWNFYGDLQKELLEVLPTNRMSNQATDMIKVLKRKFPDGTNYYIQHGIQSGTLSSPISDKKLNEKQWLKILKNEKIKNRDNLYWNNYFVDSSIRGFSDSFSRAVSEEPQKFIELVINHKEDIFTEYIDALYIGITYSQHIEEVPTELLEKLISIFKYDYISNRANYICDIVYKKSNDVWSSSIIDILADIAINHKDPEIDKVNVTSHEDKEMKSFSMLQSNSINCVRGSAAQAIGRLLWNHESLFIFFKKAIESLVSDQNPAVKLASLYTLFPSYNIDREWATTKILDLYEQDCKFAAFSGTKDMLFYLYPKYRERVLPVIMSCYGSRDNDIIRMGSYCLCEMYIRNNEFENILDNVDIMSEEQAKYILEMANLYFNNEEFNDIAKEIILKFKNSELNLEVPLSSLFYKNRINLKRDKEFLIEIMDSNMSRKTIHGFVHYLEQESKSIIDYKDIILSMSYQIIENRNIDDHIYGIDDEISKLVIGLYDETSGSSLPEIKKVAEECLNLWDLMFENHVGSIRTLSQKIMNR